MGPALAYQLRAGFVPVRKKGKLPARTISVTYDLEYGTDTLEVHEDAVEEGEKTLIVDDLIATGGTAAATVQMATDLRADLMGVACLIELDFLEGRAKLPPDLEIFSILHY